MEKIQALVSMFNTEFAGKFQIVWHEKQRRHILINIEKNEKVLFGVGSDNKRVIFANILSAVHMVEYFTGKRLNVIA